MKAYTIDQFAHFDRCVFPYDFREDLIRHGADDSDANMICDWLITRSRASIVSIYQEFVLTSVNYQGDNSLGKAIDALLDEFFTRFPAA